MDARNHRKALKASGPSERASGCAARATKFRLKAERTCEISPIKCQRLFRSLACCSPARLCTPKAGQLEFGGRLPNVEIALLGRLCVWSSKRRNARSLALSHASKLHHEAGSFQLVGSLGRLLCGRPVRFHFSPSLFPPSRWQPARGRQLAALAIVSRVACARARPARRPTMSANRRRALVPWPS